MAHRTVVVEADTLEAARAGVFGRLAPDEVVLREWVVADGRPHHVERHAATVEEACARVRETIPEGATVVEETCTHAPELRHESVQAFDETDVAAEIGRRLGPDAVVASAQEVTPHRNGFLGLGRKPGAWEVDVEIPASAELTWQQRAKVSAEVGPKEERFPRYAGSGVEQAGVPNRMDIDAERLYAVVTRGRADELALLLESGLDANASLPSGEPMLVVAACMGDTRLDLVKTLVSHGAHLDARVSGATLLKWLRQPSYRDHEETIAFLQASGAKEVEEQQG